MSDNGKHEIKMQLLKLMVTKAVDEFEQTETYQTILDNDTLEDKDTIIILEVYNIIWEGIFKERMTKFCQGLSDVEVLLDKIVELSRTVKEHEIELYLLANRMDGEVDDAAMNSYSGMVPNDEMEIFEAIEEVVYERSR
jgi:hypothetical protein